MRYNFLIPAAILLLLSLCAPRAARADSIPYTSFQTTSGYVPQNDIRTDAVIVYSDSKQRIQTWKDNGYVVQTMYGFRAGPDYVEDHKDEVQTKQDGTPVTSGSDFYMVPTPNRIRAAVDYFTNAINNGTSAAVPEEPEFFVSAGYSDSFKKAWREHYGEPWQDQTSSIEARYKSERLKAKMEYDMVKAIMNAAEKQNPAVRRMVAIHSAVSYYGWGIIYPHYECMMLPNLQEIVGQVWTGTARTHCRYEGRMAERTFENGLLEYSSLYNLVRGSGKRMWFLMDPLEDNPRRSMADYHSNYERTLIASLMFSEVDAFEVMPWPGRIYGRVPDEFATEIGSIINALEDMHNQGEVKLDMGTQGIATFVADSMGWQRGDPHKSNIDCFYGLTLPLIYRGIPIQVAQLERTPEKGYLDPYKVIMMSYDIMKPMKPEYNQAIADWVKKGGVVVFFGGTDAYNALPEWWKKAGFESPGADLLYRLGVHDQLAPADNDTTAREYQCGKGMLMLVGASPAHFASSLKAADRLRAIAAHACDMAGLKYREQQHLGIRRGKYIAVNTFDGEKKLEGSYVNILDPKLSVVKDPVVPPQKRALYCDVSKEMAGEPKLLYSSSKTESKSESISTTRLKLSGPLNTKGVARVFAGGRAVASVSLPGVMVEQSGDTVLLTYDNKPESVEIGLKWR